MNQGLLGYLNGIATAARNSNPPDQNTMALCDQMYQMAAWGFQDTYDSATSSLSPFYLTPTPPGPYPQGTIAPSWDSQQNLGIPDIRLVGG